MISILTFLGCNRGEDKEHLFAEIVYADSEIFIDAEKLVDPRFMVIANDLFVVGNFKHDPLIEVYELSSKKLRNSFLNIGNGPNEVLTIGNVQYISSERKLLVADLHKKRMFGYTLDEDLLKMDNPQPTIIYEREERSSYLFDKLYVGDDNLLAESRDTKGRVLLLDKSGNAIGYFLGYPDKKNVDKSLGDYNNAELYASAITVSPSLNKMALATYSAGMIDICEIKQDSIIPVWNYTEFYPQGIMVVPMGDNTAVAHTSKSRNGFTSISSSDKVIYALFSGKLLEDKTYPYGNEVYVVSWDGEKTYKILLDKSINRLAVDPEDEYIYGITPEMDIVRFKIPK